MTDEILDPRFERDLRAVLAASEPADVPPTLYASVASVTRPVVSTLPRRRGWDRRALAMLAAAAVLAIVAVGFGSGLVRLPGILPLIGGPTAVPTTQTYRLYYEVTPLDRHEPTTDELQRTLEVLRARVAAYQGTATGEVLADIPNTVAVDVVVPGDEPGRLAEVRTLLSMTGQLVGGGTVNQGVQFSMSVDELGLEPLFGPGTGTTATERPYKGQTAIDLQLSTDGAARVEAWRKANQDGILAFAVDDIVWYFHPLDRTITDGRISMLFPPDEIAAGIPRRLLALFSSGSHPNPVREVAPRGVELAPGITPEPERTPSPTVAPGQGLRVEYRVQEVLGEPATPADLDAILDIMSRRVVGIGPAFSGSSTGADTIAVGVAVPASDAVEATRIRELLGATGLVEFVPLGTIGLEGGLIDESVPRLFAGNLDPVADAGVAYDQDGNRMLQLTLEPTAAAAFATWSSSHIGELVAIVVDGEPISVPSIQSPIPDGILQVSSGGEGGWPETEAANLVALLASGRLPHPVEEISTNAAEPAPTPAPSAAPTELDVAGFAAACPAVGGCSYAVELRGADAQWRADLAVDAGGQLSAGAGLPATLEPGYYSATATRRQNPDSIGGGIGAPGPVNATCSADFAVAASDDVMLVSVTFATGSCEIRAGVLQP